MQAKTNRQHPPDRVGYRGKKPMARQSDINKKPKVSYLS